MRWHLTWTFSEEEVKKGVEKGVEKEVEVDDTH